MSAGTSLAELQTAIYARATADSQLMSLLVAFLDSGAVPTGQAFPYVDIGNATETAFDSFTPKGYESTFTLHIWDKARGFKRCYQIAARLNQLFLPQAGNPNFLTLATLKHVGTWLDMMQSMNGDPITNDIRHVPLRYRFRTQETS